jgi:4-amino-4-deoxychorismate lyase
MAKALLQLLKSFEPQKLQLPKQTLHQKDETLFETIALKEQKVQYLSFHQNRVNRAFKNFYESPKSINLEQEINHYLKAVQIDKNRTYRLKLLYSSEGVVSINHYNYQKKVINRLQMVEINTLDYSYKYSNRSIFDKIKKSSLADEYIITKNGLLTDTTIANIALFHTNLQEWHTPTTPLLRGTTRERLLQNQQLHAVPIHYSDLKNYSKIALLNAMVGFYIL